MALSLPSLHRQVVVAVAGVAMVDVAAVADEEAEEVTDVDIN